MFLISKEGVFYTQYAAAIERGELSVEDPRDKMRREKKEKEKKEKAAARGAIPNSASL